jgi:hypothetical protein
MRKVAGTSIELYLRQFCGPDDIVTPLLEDEEALARSLGLREPTPMNQRPARFWELSPKRLFKLWRRRRWPSIRTIWPHQSAREARAMVGRDIWDSYFTFAVVRNPWDRAVSNYFWRNASRGEGRPLPPGRIIREMGRDWKTIAIGGKVGVDRVIRFERLLDDFRDVCDHIGVPKPDDLPGLKTGVRPPHVSPTDVFTPRELSRIGKVCRRETEEFGYAWDSPET